MSWSLFPPPEKPSETARYEITYTEFHPCVRSDRRGSKTVTVKGHANYRATMGALREGGATVTKTRQRGK